MPAIVNVTVPPSDTVVIDGVTVAETITTVGGVTNGSVYGDGVGLNATVPVFVTVKLLALESVKKLALVL